MQPARSNASPSQAGPPQKDEDLATVDAAQAFRVVSKADSASLTEFGDDDKALATTRAAAALSGCGVYELGGGGYLVTRWGLARELSGLREVREFLRGMGVM